MKLRWIILCATTIALATGAIWYVYRTLSLQPSAAGTAVKDTSQPSVRTVNGETVVVVAPDAQRASHIEVTSLIDAPREQTRPAYATVLDLQPLFDLRSRFAAAQADLDTLTAQADNSRDQYARSRTLFEDDQNVSRKSVSDANAMMRANDAKLRSAKIAVAGLGATLRQQFGEALAAAAQAPTSRVMEHLRAGQATVLRVTLPAGNGTDAPPQITVDSPDGKTLPAQRLSAAPSTDPALQGQPWLYLVSQMLPAGTRTLANLPATGAAKASLVVPGGAVLWYGGQRWAYVKTAPDSFTRRFVPGSGDGDPSVSDTPGFHAGDQVVIQGAQLLLSEELKPRGIATVCKDPPECDD
ncbi:metal transporter [Pandoraea pnomenusa]|uniref:metal transporter n=1 Tax=Pandoraea pnomenusa TaxID=93220 RepID=UPI001ACFBBDC|nr:metal transporter [Pandoraea pnomenusa]MBN9094639.1 metal transporter [Pandoraea pnomenusa]